MSNYHQPMEQTLPYPRCSQQCSHHGLRALPLLLSPLAHWFLQQSCRLLRPTCLHVTSIGSTSDQHAPSARNPVSQRPLHWWSKSAHSPSYYSCRVRSLLTFSSSATSGLYKLCPLCSLASTPTGSTVEP